MLNKNSTNLFYNIQMKTLTKQVALVLITIGVALAALAMVLAWSGVYSFAADVQHSKIVFSVIEFVRERSIRVRAADVKVPGLDNEAARVRGAGNYEAMCAQCHLAPGKNETELSRGLYPGPPNLSKVRVEPAEAFWTIKHGIKASGMPAWGKSMSDDDIWDLVALIQKLPELKAERYVAMVKSSSGHSHSGTTAVEMDEKPHSDDANAHSERSVRTVPGTSNESTHPHRDSAQH